MADLPNGKVCVASYHMWRLYPTRITTRYIVGWVACLADSERVFVYLALLRGVALGVCVSTVRQENLTKLILHHLLNLYSEKLTF